MLIEIELDDYVDLPARQLRAKLRALRDELSRVGAPARTSLPEDFSKEEREEEGLPRAWKEAAQLKRRRVDLPEVNLEVEYQKYVLWYENKGHEIGITSWLLWAVRAYLDRGNQPVAEEKRRAWEDPTDDDWRSVLAFWRKSGSFNSLYGPAPGEAGCRVPAHLLGDKDAVEQAPPQREAEDAEVVSQKGRGPVHVHRQGQGVRGDCEPRDGNVWHRRAERADPCAVGSRDRQHQC